jgi:hypothetical protein
MSLVESQVGLQMRYEGTVMTKGGNGRLGA